MARLGGDAHAAIAHRGGPPDHETRRIEFGRQVGEGPLRRLRAGRPALGVGLGLEVIANQLVGLARQAEGLGGDTEATAIEMVEGNLETAADLADELGPATGGRFRARSRPSARP